MLSAVLRALTGGGAQLYHRLCRAPVRYPCGAGLWGRGARDGAILAAGKTDHMARSTIALFQARCLGLSMHISVVPNT